MTTNQTAKYSQSYSLYKHTHRQVPPMGQAGKEMEKISTQSTPRSLKKQKQKTIENSATSAFYFFVILVLAFFCNYLTCTSQNQKEVKKSGFKNIPLNFTITIHCKLLIKISCHI